VIFKSLGFPLFDSASKKHRKSSKVYFAERNSAPVQLKMFAQYLPLKLHSGKVQAFNDIKT